MRFLAVLTTAVALSTMADTLPASAQSPVSVTMTASPNPAAYGAAVTLSAELAGQGDGAPLGSVAFRRAGSSLGTASPNAAGANAGRIDSGYHHTCAFDTAGTVKCFGYNGFGQLGSGGYSNSAAPVALSTANGLSDPIVQLAGGNLHACALTDIGGVWCWGYNGSGQLGNGTNLSSSGMISPTQVIASGAIAVSAGNLHSCAVLDTGALRCWGDNTAGQIGDGTTTQRLVPTEPTGASSGFVAVAAGHSHTCALTTTGTVECWGAGAYGQMGNGTGNGASVPTAVSNLTGITRIMAGSYHTCALDSAATLRCWGFNGNGELGIGSTSNANLPATVGLADVVDVSAGHDGTCALTTAGAAYCWGRNNNGQIGDTTTTTRTLPTAVNGAGSGVAGVSAASGFNCLLKADGSIVCMGNSADGRLGDGSAWVGIRSVAALTIDAATAASSLPGGTADLDAVFTPTSNHLAATSSAVSHTVTPIAATLALTASTTTAKFGQAVTLTATAAAAAGTPSGSVTFKRGSTTLATVALSGGVAQLATTTLPVGTHSVTAVYAGSGSHNGVTSAVQTVTVTQADTALALTATPGTAEFGQTVTLTATATAASGGTPTGTVTFKRGSTTIAILPLSGGVAQHATATLPIGTHSVTAVYSGSETHLGTTSGTRTVVVTPSSATLALTATPATAKLGQTVTLTATASATAGGTPSGSVTFKRGSTTIATVALSNGVAQHATTTLPIGTHSVTAVYGGSGSHNAATSAARTVTVTKADATLALTATPATAKLGQTVTLTATASATAGGTPSGSVTFKRGSTTIATVALSNGVAQHVTTTLPVGTHSVTAVYGGSSSHNEVSSAARTVTVAKADATLALTATPATAKLGQTVTLTATASATAGGTPSGSVTFTRGSTTIATVGLSNGVAQHATAGGTPSGTVTFKRGSTTIATVALSNGVAQHATTTLPIGTHSVTAVYGGSGSHNEVSSAARTVTVTKADATLALTATPATAKLGQTVTLTATASATAGGTPSGSVTFKRGSTTIATVALSSGVAQHATTTLPIGTHSVTAVYGGSGSHNEVSSAARTVTVTLADISLALAAKPAAPKLGQAVTLTATASATAGGTPSGSVTFTRGSTTIATVALSNGVAQHVTTTLPVGTHSVTAVYGGSSSHGSFTSAVGTVVVAPATTTATLAAIPALVHPDEPVTVTATVAVVAPGAGSPTGVVDFKSGTTVLASKSLAAGTATTTIKLATGSHAVTAEYRGGTNFAADASPARNVLATYAKTAGDTELAPFRPIQRGLAGTTLANGSAVLAWETLTGSTAPAGIVARRVSTIGTAIGAEIAVAAPAAGAGGPQVAGLSNGTFVVVWHSGTGGAREIFMRRYSSAGSPLGAAVQVNTLTAGDQSRPAVAAVSTTGYVVVWQSAAADGSGFGILQRHYTLAGVALGAPTAVNGTTAGDQTRPAVAGLTNGDTAVAFASPSGTGTAVRVRRFDPAGVARGADAAVTGVLTAIPEVAIHPLAAGAFAVAWAQPDTAGAAIRDAMMQRYTAAGAKTGGAIRLDTVTAGTQTDPSMAFLDADRLAVVWTGPDSAQEGVRAQAFMPSSGARVGALIPVAADEAGRALGPVALRLGDGTTWLAAWAQTITGQGDKIMIRRFDRP